ncbi:MAG: AAA family ATPase, partial [Treponema sp.]|nr:AAA family ATPase [Treponema sp.]
MQDFRQIITKNFVYVDKTRYLFEMLDNGKFYFMSRPRRFGKTLTVST